MKKVVNCDQDNSMMSEDEADFIEFANFLISHLMSTKLELEPCDDDIRKYTGWSYKRWLRYYKKQTEEE